MRAGEVDVGDDAEGKELLVGEEDGEREGGKVEEERGWTCVKEADMGGTDEKRRTYEGARREVASTKESKVEFLVVEVARLSSRTQQPTHSGSGRRCSSW